MSNNLPQVEYCHSTLVDLVRYAALGLLQAVFQHVYYWVM